MMNATKMRQLAMQIKGMRSPVRCTHCHHVYDLQGVEIVARYTDCSVWLCPGHRGQVDDRPAGWKLRCDYERIDVSQLGGVDMYGRAVGGEWW